MGMISQTFNVLEASARDPAESWYVGRDIGRVGYYTDVRIFDTDGLFTREVARDASWREDMTPSADLVTAALSKMPVSTDLIGPWAYVLGAHRKLITGWSIDQGSKFVPYRIRPPGQTRPGLEEIGRRYEDLVGRMPSLFFMQTLYGEPVGAHVLKRARFIRRLVERAGPVDRDEVPEGLAGAGAVFGGGVVRLHGCAMEAATPGAEAYLECYFERLGDPPFQYWIFVHVEGDQVRLVADHLPINDLVPLDSWSKGQIMRDVCLIDVYPDVPPGLYRVFIGFFRGPQRVKVEPAVLTDIEGRVIGPLLVVDPE
jgi:hypothetical protein